MLMDIHSLNRIDYAVRSTFASYLETTGFGKAEEYIKVLDRMKLYAIRESNNRFPKVKRKLTYRPQLIYLGYHPDYAKAMEFYYTRDKTELVFDFSIEASEILKRQVFKMLNYCLDRDMDGKNRRELYLVPLKKLYLFCAQQGIGDIEKMQEKQIEAFRHSMEGKVGTKTMIYMQIVGSTRRFLFMSAPKINWDANVWYMDRFRLGSGQVNPANHMECLRFLKIYDVDNLATLKGYIRYLIEVRRTGMKTVQARHYIILRFLLYCEERRIKVRRITERQLEQYVAHLMEQERTPSTFNQSVSVIKAFFQYLFSEGEMEDMSKMLKKMDFYRETDRYVRHDRIVDPAGMEEFLHLLGSFPEDLRLMCLNILATGIRVNEACTIKGDAYSHDGKDAWLSVMQYKVSRVKTVPIPERLYELMTSYIDRNGIQAGEFVFRSRKGRAYDALTFRIQVQRLCRDCGMTYIFRPRDLRHQIATELYEKGVPLDQISDFLGHKKIDMTGRYIDVSERYMDEETRKYFAQNSLEDPSDDMTDAGRCPDVPD